MIIGASSLGVALRAKGFTEVLLTEVVMEPVAVEGELVAQVGWHAGSIGAAMEAKACLQASLARSSGMAEEVVEASTTMGGGTTKGLLAKVVKEEEEEAVALRAQTNASARSSQVRTAKGTQVVVVEELIQNANGLARADLALSWSATRAQSRSWKEAP
mmetsp:Transcript_66745/g.148206  ORF Transcript_66745/g.148206 Transcript_66745/m.148206 type:complete len:159 (+) Transcript_66745:1008-1484(+)